MTMRAAVTVWGPVAVLTIFWAALGSLVLPAARSHDFLNLYTGASLALEGRFAELHDPAVQLERERRIYPTERLVPFVRPPFYAALLAPLALLSYETAFRAWLAFQIALLGGCWWWGFKAFGNDAPAYGALYLPTALGIAHGQDGVLILTIVIVAWVLDQKEKPFAAGAMLALGLIKFHLFLLWPVVLLAQRRMRVLAGWVAGAAALGVISFALAGPAGVSRYAALLTNRDLDRLSPTPEFMISTQGLAANLAGGSAIVQIGVAALVVLAVMWAAVGAPRWRAVGLASAGSLAIAPHVYGYDAALLMLGLWLALYRSARKFTRIAAAILVIPITFGLTLADKPWAAAASIGLLMLIAALAHEGRE